MVSSSNAQPARTLYVIITAAPPALAIGEFVDLAKADGWDVVVIATPVTATWIDAEQLAKQTGHPVRSQPRPIGATDDSPLPRADAVILAPATFNTINKWGAGISDTFALGVLNEAIGLDLPVVASPFSWPVLAQRHPAFARNVAELQASGVMVTEHNALAPATEGGPYRWQVLLDALKTLEDDRAERD